MCGRTVNALEASEISAKTHADASFDMERFRPSYNICPTRYAPILLSTSCEKFSELTSQVEQDKEKREGWAQKLQQEGKVPDLPSMVPDLTQFQPDDQVKYLRTMKWGLVPNWTKTMPGFADTRNTINARDDTVLQSKSMWAHLKNHRRCIVPMQGFYEWQKIDEAGTKKVPHLVRLPDDSLMLMAGLWDTATVLDEGRKVVLNTFTIITTANNKQLEFLHDRMPVILSEDDVDDWLNPEIPFEKVAHLLKPYDKPLNVIPVTSFVGNVKNDGEECIRPATMAEVEMMKSGKKVVHEFGQQSISKFFTSPKTTPTKSVGGSIVHAPVKAETVKETPTKQVKDETPVKTSIFKDEKTPTSAKRKRTPSPSKPNKKLESGQRTLSSFFK